MVAEGLGFSGKIEANRGLYQGSASDYLHAIQRTSTKVATLLFVAHNPSVSDLLSVLKHSRISLSTAGYEIVRNIKEWHELGR